MTRDRLQRELHALRRLVDWIEADDPTRADFPFVIEFGHALFTVGTSGLTQIKTMTRQAVDLVRAELRAIVRGLAAGQAVTVQPLRIGYSLVPHVGTQSVSTIVEGARDGQGRDYLLAIAVAALNTAAIGHLRLCPAPDCGKAFVKLTKQQFCSTRCQSRAYMRQRRADVRAAFRELEQTTLRAKAASQKHRRTLREISKAIQSPRPATPRRRR